MSQGLGGSKEGGENFYRDHLTKWPRSWTPGSNIPVSSVLVLPRVSYGTVRKSTNFSGCHCLDLKNGIRRVLIPAVLRI